MEFLGYDLTTLEGATLTRHRTVKAKNKTMYQLVFDRTPDNGFGETPLKKYRRHIFLLHPYTVVIYDELESSENVRWDWLLHSPVEFDIDQKNGKM